MKQLFKYTQYYSITIICAFDQLCAIYLTLKYRLKTELLVEKANPASTRKKNEYRYGNLVTDNHTASFMSKGSETA